MSTRTVVAKRGQLEDLVAPTQVRLLCHVLRVLVPFVQFKERDKHTWRSDTFSKVRG